MNIRRITVSIVIEPIGIIHSPYTEPAGMPIQGIFKPEIEARLEVYEPYRPGLRDLDGFSHAIILYHFHRAQQTELVTRPFLEDVEHGVFTTRSPKRPNHIGLSIIKIVEVTEDRIRFTDVDLLDQTPVIDIKPYVKYFDIREDTRHGWLDKHFKNGPPTDRTTIKKT